jgi:hypothetical protein
VHAIRDAVEFVVEQAGVHVEGHRGRGVPEHPLNGLDAGAARMAARRERRRPRSLSSPTDGPADAADSGRFTLQSVLDISAQLVVRRHCAITAR